MVKNQKQLDGGGEVVRKKAKSAAERQSARIQKLKADPAKCEEYLKNKKNTCKKSEEI